MSLRKAGIQSAQAEVETAFPSVHMQAAPGLRSSRRTRERSRTQHHAPSFSCGVSLGDLHPGDMPLSVHTCGSGFFAL